MLMYFLWLSDTNDVPAAPATAGCEEELPPPGPTNIYLGCSYSRLRFSLLWLMVSVPGGI